MKQTGVEGIIICGEQMGGGGTCRGEDGWEEQRIRRRSRRREAEGPIAGAPVYLDGTARTSGDLPS